MTTEQLFKLEQLVMADVCETTYDDDCCDEADRRFSRMADDLDFDIDESMTQEQYDKCIIYVSGKKQ